MKHILYGAEVSYFTGKARSYLRWKGVDFEERNADVSFYKNICIPRIGRPVIPVLITPDDIALQDTTQIIDHFEQQEGQVPSLTPSSNVQNLLSLLIELFADDWLLIPAMHYRWEYDANETMLEFGMNLAPGKSIDEQRSLGEKRSSPFSGARPFLGIHSHNKHAIEQSWLALLAELDTHFRAHPYLLGNKPCAGDFGLVGALYAHLYRDATAGALMRKKALAVARYVERMVYADGQPIGDYLENDAVPETLIPILQRMMREQMPVLASTIEHLAAWKVDNPDTDIPRSIGQHSFSVGGVAAERMIFPYSTWMHGRARAIYDALNDTETAKADEVLDQCGGALFQSTLIKTPVDLINHKIQWAN